MMQTYLFDDKGELWDGKSRQLADALHASLSSEDLLKYVVRNLGFIAVTENSGSLRLQLRPAVVSQMALGGLLYWLHDHDIERVLISSLDEEWSHELVRTREEAVRRLLMRVKFIPADRDGDFLNKPRSLHHLPVRSPLRAVLGRLGRNCGGKYDPERLQPVVQKAARWSLCACRGAAMARPACSSRTSAGGLGDSAEYWLSRTRGLRVEDQPDYAYGKWVARALPQGLSDAGAQPRGCRCRHHLAAAAAHKLSLSAPDRALRGGAQLNPGCWARR